MTSLMIRDNAKNNNLNANVMNIILSKTWKSREGLNDFNEIRIPKTGYRGCLCLETEYVAKLDPEESFGRRYTGEEGGRVRCIFSRENVFP